MSRAFIGTSGWQYSNWRGSFYPQDLPQSRWLTFYAKTFDTVEVNSSFYRQTKASTFQKWQAETPPNFVFAIKGNRFITHIKRLHDCCEPLEVFFENVSVLSSLPIILWQLPPSLRIHLKMLDQFLCLLPKKFRHAFEFRHHSWVNDKTWQLLSKYNCAVVAQDWHEWPMVREVTADFIYLRFHGAKILYTSGYLDKELEEWAKIIKKFLHDGKDVYAYFNNDAAGFAVPNALASRKFISL